MQGGEKTNVYCLIAEKPNKLVSKYVNKRFFFNMINYWYDNKIVKLMKFRTNLNIN